MIQVGPNAAVPIAQRVPRPATRAVPREILGRDLILSRALVATEIAARSAKNLDDASGVIERT